MKIDDVLTDQTGATYVVYGLEHADGVTYVILLDPLTDQLSWTTSDCLTAWNEERAA